MTQLTKYLEIFEFGGLAGWINMFEHISLVLGVSQDGEGKLSTAPNAAQDSSSNLGKMKPLITSTAFQHYDISASSFTVDTFKMAWCLDNVTLLQLVHGNSCRNTSNYTSSSISAKIDIIHFTDMHVLWSDILNDTK